MWKREHIYPSHEIEKSVFKNSKLIDLTKFSTNTVNEYFIPILEHIFNNYDFYYSDDISEKEIAESIFSLVKEKKKIEEQQKTKRLIPNKRKDD